MGVGSDSCCLCLMTKTSSSSTLFRACPRKPVVGAAERVTYSAFRYDPSSAEMPPGFKAQTTSMGARAIVPRSDGIHWMMDAFDVALEVEGEWVALPAPAFSALFEEVPE